MSERLLVGTRKGLFTLLRKPTGWEIDKLDFIGHPVTMLLHDPRDGAMYASLTLGHFGSKLHRSDDGGGNWTEVSVPIYPEDAVKYAPSMDPDIPPTTKPASLSEIWALESAGDTHPNCLWAGTIPGGLFLSEDRGESWRLIESLWNRAERADWFGGGKDDPGIHSVCVDPRDDDKITIGISCGGVWQTHDFGQNWELLGEGIRADFMPPDMQFKKSIQDAHRIAVCRDHPEVHWVQHHNGIFRSVDDSQTYVEIEQAGPSVFGFAVCAHPNDPETAWFVPAIKDEVRVPVDGQLVVTRTRDGGKTFETLRSGLPQTHCYDIVFRHALDIDATGNRLVMGSSTGGLWITEDQGDRWQNISNTLPQIYVTRFSP